MDTTIVQALKIYGLATVISFAVAGLMKLMYLFVGKKEGEAERIFKTCCISFRV